MKNNFKMMVFMTMSSITLTSCYSYTSVVGKGAQNNVQITKWNHYLFEGIAPVGVSDSKQMAGDSENYTVLTRQTFLNGFITAITLDIYSPTTTTVTK